jgi:sugar phosphate isomerase/epimerase
MSALPPLTIGVCSWSLLVRNLRELRARLDAVGLNVVQIACGDPHHAAWEEGDDLPAAAKAAGFVMTGAMLGFPGEDYTTPQTIAKTGGFGDPATRPERLERFRWAVERTLALGLNDLMFHAGFIPPRTSADYPAFLKTLAAAAALGEKHGVTLALETGQETAPHLLQFIQDLNCPNVKVNFDPANMLLYDMGDPIAAVKLLGPHIRSVHVKDAFRPTTPGTWGTEQVLGQGAVNIPLFVETLVRVGFTGPLVIERSVETPEQAVMDIRTGLAVLKQAVNAACGTAN